MSDVNRVGRRSCIEVGASQVATFGGFGVIVFEPQHPFPRRSASRSFADCGLDRRDRTEIRVHAAQVHATRDGRMRMRIYESGKDSTSAEIHHAGMRSPQRPDVGVHPDCEKPVAADRDRLRAGP
jgi:hypothetical protein